MPCNVRDSGVPAKNAYYSHPTTTTDREYCKVGDARPSDSRFPGKLTIHEVRFTSLLTGCPLPGIPCY